MQVIRCLIILSVLFISCKEKAAKLAQVVQVPKSIPQGMVYVPGGEFTMGNSAQYAEEHEGPEIQAFVDGFFMDETEVTNAQFAAFVEATGYITVAERDIDWEEIKKELPEGTPKIADSLLQAGSLVFTPPAHAVPLHDYTQWWRWITGANWRHPYGPKSDIGGKENYPVVQIAYEDAQAYAKWAGKRLPTEAEYEFASNGGTQGNRFVWGDEISPGGSYLANFFQGDFPHNNTIEDGFDDAAPVKSFPANNYGLYDMIGNVWEWTSDLYRPDTKIKYLEDGTKLCYNPKGPSESYDPTDPFATEKRVIKGGSFLCSDQYCFNYRPSSRMANSSDSGQNHVGFRCVKDLK